MSARRPILVHQMGKVGSRSVVDSLHASLPDAQIEHLHTVTEAGLSGVRARYTQRGMALPPHVADGERVRRDIIDAGLGADIITMVREPVGRNVSAFFQNSVGKLAQASDEQVDELCRTFIDSYPHTQPIQWFKREFDHVYGITMHAQPFNAEQGTRAYEAGRFRVLVLQCELPDETKQTQIAAFLGLPGLTWVRSNETNAKAQRHVYARFKERLRLPTSVVDQLYGSAYSRHFYTHDQLTRFRAKWAREPLAQAPSGTASAG